MVITLNRLKAAIARKMNLAEPEARKAAERVLSYFGFTNVIIDNVLDPADRKLFYQLNDAGLLHSYAESLTLQNGRNWRIFYWEISDKNLRDAVKRKRKKVESTYSSLPQEYWTRARANT